MIKSDLIIWVLADDRPGNYSQALGLAEAILRKLYNNSKARLEIKKINYNFLANLPNFLKIDGMMGIDNSSRKTLLSNKLSPNLIISAGRKTAPIIAFLKKHYQNSSPFIVQIMHPNFSFNKFDLVILPNHDRYFGGFFNKPKNIIRIDGALTRISPQLLEAEYQKFSLQFDNIKQPKIAFLVGGSSKKGKFSQKTVKDLGFLVSKITNNMQAHLLAINSRRTGEDMTKILDENLLCSKTFFKWQKENWQNPYFAVLQVADFIIATGDSISMCSEICSLGKPIYIFNPKQICSAKHLRFHQGLFDYGLAKKLELTNTKLENCSAKRLDETENIAKLIVDSVFIAK